MDPCTQLSCIELQLAKLRNSEAELLKKRDLFIGEIRVCAAMRAAAQPSQASQIARALIDVHTQNGWGFKQSDPTLYELFWMQSAEVNTAGLLQMAEWRDAKVIEMFLKNGADVNGTNSEGFSVLEQVLQGHDGYWRGKDYWNPEVLEVLTKYKVDRRISHHWIIDQACSEAPQYVHDFLSQPARSDGV